MGKFYKEALEVIAPKLQEVILGLQEIKEVIQEALNIIEDNPKVIETTRIRAALNTLEALGYSYRGGDTWKPPLGMRG